MILPATISLYLLPTSSHSQSTSIYSFPAAISANLVVLKYMLPSVTLVFFGIGIFDVCTLDNLNRILHLLGSPIFLSMPNATAILSRYGPLEYFKRFILPILSSHINPWNNCKHIAFNINLYGDTLGRLYSLLPVILLYSFSYSFTSSSIKLSSLRSSIKLTSGTRSNIFPPSQLYQYIKH